MTDKDIANAKPTSKRPTVNRRSLLKKITIGVLTVKADMGFFALSAYSQQIGRPVRAIDLQGRHPGVPAITPDWKYAVSVNQESHNLSLVSLSNLQLDKTIDLTAKREPWKVAFRADAPIGFVTHSSFETSHDDNSVVTAVDYAQGRELAQIPVGKRPNGVAVDRTNSLVFVTNKGSATVSVIDARTFQVIKTIPVGNKPNDVELTPDNKFALVVNYEDATVSFIDVAGLQVVDTVRTGRAGLSDPYPIWGAGDSVQIAVHPVTGEAYVSNYRSGDIAAIDTVQRKVRKHIPCIRFPFGIGVEANTNTLTVVSGESRQMGVVELGPTAAMTQSLESAPTSAELKARPEIKRMMAQVDQQIEVIPWGQGAGKPPQRLINSRAKDVTQIYVDPIKGVMYVMPAAQNTFTQSVFFNQLPTLETAAPQPAPTATPQVTPPTPTPPAGDFSIPNPLQKSPKFRGLEFIGPAKAGA